jgi:RHS repeat-associated protein
VKDVAYNYSYDPMNRITGASYLTNNAGAWSNTNAFSENGYAYDLNGNIKSMVRNSSSGTAMDNMTYTYNGNQLLSVTDTGDKTKGFIDGANTGNDYDYDANGNMKYDLNKSLGTSLTDQTHLISYNHLNLPAQVVKNTGEKIIYTYDASGRKLRQQVYNTTGALTKTTDYDGEYIYQNDTLKFINHEEGRVIMNVPPGGSAPTPPEYQYHLKDHLGNVRLTFTTTPLTDVNTATYEDANINVEQNKFLRYANARRINAAIFDHTNGNSTTTGYSERLNGSANEIYGLARSMSVMPGDVINAEVYAKYVDLNSSNWTAALNTLMGQIAANTAGVVVDGTGYSTSTSSFPAGYGSLVGKTDDGAPKAYLNWLVFDRNFVFVTGGFKQITAAAKESGTDGPHEYVAMPSPLTITQPGYVYIYLSNENGTPVEVYFDDFKVTQTNSLPVVQQEDFYPFGLTFNSYTRENAVPQNYLYNGKELQKDLGLNWEDYGWRFYDPEIGRWYVVDPASEEEDQESWTPYHYVFNNPTRNTDPDGRIAIIDNLIGAAIGAAVDYGTQVAANYVSGKENPWTDNINVSSIAVSATSGFITSGASTLVKAATNVVGTVVKNTVQVKTSQDGLTVNVEKNAVNIAKNTAIDLAANKLTGKLGGKVESKITKAGLTNAGALSSTTKAVVRATGTNITRANTASIKKGIETGAKVAEKVTTGAAKAITNPAKNKLKESTNLQ